MSIHIPHQNESRPSRAHAQYLLPEKAYGKQDICPYPHRSFHFYLPKDTSELQQKKIGLLSSSKGVRSRVYNYTDKESRELKYLDILFFFISNYLSHWEINMTLNVSFSKFAPILYWVNSTLINYTNDRK